MNTQKCVEINNTKAVTLFAIKHYIIATFADLSDLKIFKYHEFFFE